MKRSTGGRLSGKVAIVTGAARGIGRAIAERFIVEGALVLATDIREDEGRAIATDLGPAAEFHELDVREGAQWERVTAAALERHDRLDVLVNNAGITGFEGDASEPQDPERATLDAWRSVHATNLDGVFLGCQHALRAMRACGVGSGSIVNIGSRSGVVGVPAAAAYASSKAGVRNHTKTVALYCAEQSLPIRCNVIQPAAILTPMWDAVLGEGEERRRNMEAFAADCPLRRFGTPEEVAAVAVFLASDESSYVTGAEFTVDGGTLAGTASTPGPREGA